ncbi:PH domain leucine-rich repeat-containing protein phosphatase 2 isoform X1 [Polypterus senegalus]|uniref:PH domain leucine-rich repeat-containing protein phosphatase 2 isoform X1 n=1 Tax=Polypterus senegalus TaxID=55291 RepID=UPI0019656387|nr:PH domain leucine-rich repeat-containing protein phosphatase 2 isoform X1 [Polypterus senegalus]
MEEGERAAGAAPASQGGGGGEDSGSHAGILHGPEPNEVGLKKGIASWEHGPQGSRLTGIRVLKRNMKRNGSRSCVTRKSRFGSRERDWLKEDRHRGCLYVYRSGEPQQTVTVPSSSTSSSSSNTSQSDLRLVLCTTDSTVAELCAQSDIEGLYLQMHGDFVRKLDNSERPLQIFYDYLSAIGYEEPACIQKEAANSDFSCMIRFYSERPNNADQLEWILLKGIFSVRKGKTQLHKWAERQVILCGTCLIVASVKESFSGKMHILPLVGGKVEKVKRRLHCLMFSSAGPQAQAYFVNFDSLVDYQRWYRQASKVVSQTASVVDLSCYSLEEVPEYLFYSQDITHLNLRHNFIQIAGLHNFSRFSQLKSLNLSHNHLGQFPQSLCEILSLTELNLSCNGINQIPVQIGNLQSLQTLYLEGNHLNSLPEELSQLSQLICLSLSFNDFTEIPAILERLTNMERLFMAGNHLETLHLGTLYPMNHLKYIDFRLNGLREVVSEGLEAVKNITSIDMRDNCLTELDLSSVCCLEQLYCQRNGLKALSLSGFALRALYASCNCLETVNVYPVPNLLTHIDLSRNLLECLPHWISDTRKLEVLDASHNLLVELTARLLSSLSLRKLHVGYNQLSTLPYLVDHIPLEVLDLQHNKLVELPENLFYKALNLRYLNVSANLLETIPPCSQSDESLSTLQELYLTNNNLTAQCATLLAGHQNLRVLHIAYNQLLSFPASKLTKLELLEELNLSGNKLKTIPSTVANCKKLRTFLAHSNHVSVFPDVLSLPEIKLVDLSCNELTEIALPESLPPSLQELDLSGNTNLILEHKTLNLFSHIPTLKLDQKPTSLTGDSMGSSTLWNHGYSEMSGQRNKLCLSVLAMDNFGDNVEATYAIFDGDRNEEVPRLLQCTMGDVLLDETQHSAVDSIYMTNTFLSSHRKLGMAGQKLGASAVLCYIHHDPADPGTYFSLSVANVGTCQALLCRGGQPLPLSVVFSLEQSPEETRRMKANKAIITEDNKVSGVTCCTRQLGCSYLFPWVIPKPWMKTVPLCAQDEFLILGNRALFEWISYQEAVSTVQAMQDPRAAAKKLCTLAQSYGCQDNVGTVVVSLHIGEDSCTCELPLPTVPGCTGTVPAIYPNSVLLADPATPSSSSGIASEFNSEMSASEVGSEAGSTASDEHLALGLTSRPERRCSLHPAAFICGIGSMGNNLELFQRQPSCATFSSNQSDNGLDSDDETPLDGVISNGSKLEVEVDIHCCAFRLRGSKEETSVEESTSEEQKQAAHKKLEESVTVSSTRIGCRLRRQSSIGVPTNTCHLSVCKEISDLKKSPSTSSLFGKKLSNGSVVPLEESHNAIEVALEAPKKKSGYFAAPAQQDPEDNLVVPSNLEQEVQDQLRLSNPNSMPTLSQPPSSLEHSEWNETNSGNHQQLQLDHNFTTTHQEVYDTAL